MSLSPTVSLSPYLPQPNRTYYLEDPTGHSKAWVDTINKWLSQPGPSHTH